MTERRITDARASELARLIEATRVSVGPLGHDDDILDDLAGWMLSHGDNLLADRAADRGEIERLQRLLKLRDRQMVQARQQWMRAAEKALAGDTRDLWLRVEMAKQPPVDVVLSDAAPPDADPAVLARHAAVQAGDLSGTVDLPDPRDAVVEARKALEKIAEGHLPDQPAASGPDEYTWAQQHIGRLRLIARDALAALDAAGRQGGREP